MHSPFRIFVVNGLEHFMYEKSQKDLAFFKHYMYVALQRPAAAFNAYLTFVRIPQSTVEILSVASCEFVSHEHAA
jgi:uncharacterized membrane protein YphA (DoxX/SURF4 family)